ncbi:MAG TPA: hypothetical protein VN836_11950 [Verrucomicrobiae bacterium]|nr:hypothetical protein [Verrucomicrobiae bacterium]
MKHQSQFSDEQQSRQAGTEHQTQPEAAREFASAEEMLRYDAKQTAVPPEIARRLQKSTGDLPGPKTAWWKRWLGGGQ